jgi:hypothetical protein
MRSSGRVNGFASRDLFKRKPAIQTAPDLTYITQSPTAPILGGQPFTLRAVATGGGLSWQWNRNGAPIAGANRPFLALASSTAADAGDYTVTVTNSVNSDTSGVITLVFPSLLGKSYRVDYSPDLGTTPWTPLGTYPGTGAEMTRSFAANGGSGFYQVVELGP